MGAASASQLMAAVESRELVSAVRSFADPNAPRPTCLREEREQKAEQQLEHRGTNCENVYGKCTPHLTRGAASQKLQSEPTRVCGAAAHNSIAALSASAFVRRPD